MEVIQNQIIRAILGPCSFKFCSVSGNSDCMYIEHDPFLLFVSNKTLNDIVKFHDFNSISYIFLQCSFEIGRPVYCCVVCMTSAVNTVWRLSLKNVKF